MKRFIHNTVALIASCLFTTVAFADNVAKIGTTEYETLAGAVAAATAGQTVTLLADVTLTQRVEPNKDMTIDLDSKTITTTATCGNGSAFDVKSGNVTIQNGTINASFGEANSGETDAITARSGSNVTLKDLNITVNSKNGSCAYAFGGAHITIESGEYKNLTTESYQYNANFKALVVNQANVAEQLVTINGGTFVGQDPSAGDDSGKTNTFLPSTLATQLVDGHYEIVAAVAQIDNKGYATLADAFAAAKEGDTVKLLTNIEGAAENTNDNSFTLDMNGKTWTSDATATLKNNGGTITVTGNGTIVNTANAEDMGITVWARTGSVVIENGTFISQSNYEATLYVGTTAANLGSKTPTITVNGGTVKNEAEGKYHWKESLLPLTLNVINTLTYQGIIIKGGTFYGNDPGLGDDNISASSSAAAFVDPDYHAVKNPDGTYGVVEGGYVAHIGDDKYLTIEEALEAAGTEEEKTITLLANVTIDKNIDVPANVTIDPNEKILTFNLFIVKDGVRFRMPATSCHANNATYTRENLAGLEWGTVCLPYALQSKQDDYTLYNINNISESTLTVDEVETGIAAGTPIIFQKKDKAAASVTITATDVDITDAEPVAGNQLFGTYDKQVKTTGLENIYYINSDAFHKAMVSLTIPTYRAYIDTTVANPAKTLMIRVSNAVSGIDAAEYSTSAPAVKKYLNNGNLVIESAGRTYTVTGATVNN